MMISEDFDYIHCRHYFYDTLPTMSCWHFVMVTIVRYSRLRWGSNLILQCKIGFLRAFTNVSEMVPWCTNTHSYNCRQIHRVIIVDKFGSISQKEPFQEICYAICHFNSECSTLVYCILHSHRKNCVMLWVIFIPCTFGTDLSNLIYLPISVDIITAVIWCLNKKPFKKYNLLIYLFMILIFCTYLYT